MNLIVREQSKYTISVDELKEDVSDGKTKIGRKYLRLSLSYKCSSLRIVPFLIETKIFEIVSAVVMIVSTLIP